MSNNFIKRVAKLLDGLPMHGYSESCKPIRAAVNGCEGIKKRVQSEFEIHNQVLYNTWGRIEFEIEPLNQFSIPDNESEQKSELDYKVRVKTNHRITPPKNLNPSLAPIAPTPLKAISNEEIRNLIQDHQKQIAPQISQIYSQKASSLAEDKVEADASVVAEKEKVEKQKIELEQKLQSAKSMIRKEFACRESRRMMTLITERKVQAAILREKSVFANFALPVLETLARSPQTPKSSLKWLAFHENPNIRKAVAKNRNTDLEILAILARDENESIRMTVAENPRVDKEFLLKLLNDGQDTVVSKAQNILHEMVRSQAIENNRATLSALKEYVDAREPNKQYVPNEADFMQVIAAKDTTPTHRLSQLSQHENWNVRLAVANNPSATRRTLAVLAQDSVPIIRKRALLNANCPAEMTGHSQKYKTDLRVR